MKKKDLNIENIRNNERKSSTTHDVLLIQSDPKATELYCDLIREVEQNTHIDIMSRARISFDWLANTSYDLVVIDETFIYTRDTGDDSSSTIKITGLGILEKIKRSSPTTSVLIISSRASVEHAVDAIKLGAEDYLKKPFNLESFKMAIQRGLHRKAVFGTPGATGFLELFNICQMISASLEEKKIFEIVLSYISRELRSNYAGIYAYYNDKPMRVPVYGQDQEVDLAKEEIVDIAVNAANPFADMENKNEYFRFINKTHTTPSLFIFHFNCGSNQKFYYVCLSPKKPSAIDVFQSRLIMLKAQIEVTGNNIQEYMGVKHLAYLDDVTGLYNTRYMSYVLDLEIQNAKENNLSFAVLFIDVDKFKSVNDTHGHLIGTRLLTELGRHLKKQLRNQDNVFRYGGDEFVAVLSPCKLEKAKVIGERIRSSVEKHHFLESDGGGIQFSVSIGIALYPDHAVSKKAIVEAADNAMYKAKKFSRNCVYVLSEKGEPEVLKKIS